jgi:hypothetical protein
LPTSALAKNPRGNVLYEDEEVDGSGWANIFSLMARERAARKNAKIGEQNMNSKYPNAMKNI